MRPYDTTSYRYPRERIILAITLITVLLVIALTATATICLSVVFVLGIVMLAFFFTRSHHMSLMQNADKISQDNSPELLMLVNDASDRLQLKMPVDIFVVRSNKMNAYTFGLSSPKSIVFNSILLQEMDKDELQFIIGHEMGHIKLGHTWLNTLIGGMAGIPSPFAAAALLVLIFRWWNRSCELSADRAGLLACNNARKAVTAMLKLSAGRYEKSGNDLQSIFREIDAEDDELLNNVAELFATHPMMIKRIENIRRYIGSSEYRNLQVKVNRNLRV